MNDCDLAEMYGVETRILNQAVKRNFESFPDDFKLQLTELEFQHWKSQIVISNYEKWVYEKNRIYLLTSRY